MMKSLLLLVVLASTMLASTHAFFEAKQRLIGRVIHFESNLKRGRWLMDSGESAGNLYIDEMPKDEIYFEPKVQFKVLEIIIVSSYVVTLMLRQGDLFRIMLRQSLAY